MSKAKKNKYTRISQRLTANASLSYGYSGNCEHTIYTPKTKSLQEASQEQVFATCYRDVTALVFSQNIYLYSSNKRQTQDLKNIKNFLSAVDIDAICRAVYQNEFLGSGWGLLRVNANDAGLNVEYIPSQHFGKTLLTANRDVNTNRINSVSYHVTSTPEIIQLNNQNILLSLHNTEQPERSILGQIYDLIDLKFAIQESMLRLASRNNQPVSFVHPDYTAFPRVGSVDQDARSLAELMEETKNVKSNFRSINAKTNLVFSTIPLQLNVVGIDEIKARSLEKIKWIDSQIYLATGLNGTFLETNNSNRASAEQGMDNVLLTTVKFWTDKFIKIREKVIHAIAPGLMASGKYYFTSDVILTAEKLEQQRVQNEIERNNIAKLDLILRLANTEYKVDKSSVNEILQNLGLKLVGTDRIPQPTHDIRVLKDEDNTELSQLPETAYKNIQNKQPVQNAITDLMSILDEYYQDVWQDNKVNTDLDVNQYLTPKKMDQLAELIQDETIKDWNDRHPAKVTKNEKVKQKVQNAINYHFNGGQDYQGFAFTVKETLEGVIEGADDTNIADYYKSRINTLTKNTAKRIEDGLFVNLYYSVSEQLAVDTKQDYVGAITVGDDRVRESHRKNEKKYWKLGKIAPSGNATPWLDYGDRCSYFYNSSSALEKAGFKKAN